MLEQGKLIGERYEIVEVIGSGGMANVYKAKDTKLNRFVAVKVLKPEFKDDETFVSKFKIEAQSAAGLSHPNIVNVFDVGDEDGVNYIVMELIEGITLKEYIEKKGKLSIKEATSIAIQVSMGLEAAHNNKIIHRDVKPQNIIISTDGKVKVTDFGIARAASSNTISSNVMGSVHYSSPEQARGGYSDEKSDIYSLGVTMYEMVTGKVPFDGETTVAIAIKHLQEEMESPKSHTPDLPFSVEQIIYKCTQKSADRRYMNMEELIADLKQSLVNPDGDFVQVLPLNNHAQTVMISKEELEQINNERKKDLEPEEETDEDNEDDEDEDDEDIDDEDEDDEDDDEDDEEDEDEYINPKLEKAMTIGGIIVGVIILAIFISLIGNALGWFSFTNPFGRDRTETESESESETANELVEVPDLRGMTYEQAEEALEERGLKIKRSTESPQPSDEYEEGQIIEQNVNPNVEVEEGTVIEVIVSSGAEQVEIPELANKSQTVAEVELRSLNLQIRVVNEYSSSVPNGSVIGTTPSAGEMVPVNSTVTLTVSRGAETRLVTVPGVVGYSETDARATLSSAGLAVTNVSSDYSSEYAAGVVMLQSLSEGTQVAEGSGITLVVSLGEKPAENVTYQFSRELQNPGNYEGGNVRIILTQDGQDTIIKDGEPVTFPITISGTSTSGSSGTVKVYEWNEAENTYSKDLYGTGIAVDFTQQ